MIILVKDCEGYIVSETYETFEDACAELKRYYTDPEGLINWDEDDWEDTFVFEEMKEEFEENECATFCGDCIVTEKYFEENY